MGNRLHLNRRNQMLVIRVRVCHSDGCSLPKSQKIKYKYVACMCCSVGLLFNYFRYNHAIAIRF